jgi:hypothetical protein
MTREHFQAIADTLALSRPTYCPPERLIEREQWNEDVKAMAKALLQFNPNFDRSRFIKACGELFES